MSLNNLENLYREKLENNERSVEDTTKKFESFEADIDHPKNEGVDIPKGAKEAINLDLDFDRDDIRFEGDTLVFWLSLFDNDSTKTKNANADTGANANSADSAKSDTNTVANKTSKADSTKSDKDANEKDSKYKTYTFRITKQELMQDTLKTIVNDRVTLSINKLHVEQWSEKGRSLRIEGILFIK